MVYTSNIIDSELRLPICLLYVMDAHERIEKIPLMEGGGSWQRLSIFRH